ncbi:MAG: glycosyltransferase family 2 protein [Butyrivibrio sp.]|uniref:glycosyltransferase family 2 protein n=1 Tax=Butyrivibrio sp. TaxID=28121 RepID=UPI0025C3EE2C|nr:glycosyltransferase family 2 protein [Butyrivibrio sp.]MBQ6589084.1 glycosyltransferase family 2 protein [Butyrivibrio sp.]
MADKKISFVIPCYRSENTLGSVIEEIDRTLATRSDYSHDIILVNDGSPDNTWGAICSEVSKAADGHILGINFAKNFGQHAALMAGLYRATGDYVVCLDDDGQTPADEVFKLIDALENGADVAYARYGHKQHNVFRNFGTFMNESMATVMLGKPKDLFVSSYFAARKFVVDEMVKYESSYPYVIGLVLRTTKNIVNVDVNHRKREVGQSGYTFSKLLGLWINGFTAFSIKPLRIATFSGFSFAAIGFIYGIYTVVKKFVNPAVPVGFSALMSAVIFIGGMLMLMLGMIGEYLGRVYISQNKNPQYVIRETTEDGKK